MDALKTSDPTVSLHTSSTGSDMRLIALSTRPHPARADLRTVRSLNPTATRPHPACANILRQAVDVNALFECVPASHSSCAYTRAAAGRALVRGVRDSPVSPSGSDAPAYETGISLVLLLYLSMLTADRGRGQCLTTSQLIRAP
jgi:hypothetical protein